MSRKPLIIGIILLAAVLAGVFFLTRKPANTVVNKVVVTQTQSPSPTEMPKIDKTTVKIQVVNGTGVAGQASTVIKALTDAGYNADNIKSTNATIFNNTITTVTGRTNFDVTANDIATILKSNFNNIAVSSAKLDDTNAFDIVVLTGGKMEATITPSSSSNSTSISSSSSSSTIPTSTPAPTVNPTPTP